MQLRLQLFITCSAQTMNLAQIHQPQKSQEKVLGTTNKNRGKNES